MFKIRVKLERKFTKAFINRIWSDQGYSLNPYFIVRSMTMVSKTELVFGMEPRPIWHGEVLPPLDIPFRAKTIVESVLDMCNRKGTVEVEES